MNTKVEEALGVLGVVAGVSFPLPAKSLRQARTVLAKRIAEQEVMIARLSELVLAVKSSDYEISCGDVSTGNWFDARTALIAALNQE